MVATFQIVSSSYLPPFIWRGVVLVSGNASLNKLKIHKYIQVTIMDET
jgi:hypothetical protein